MVSTPPSLLRERVNAKHTGVMSKQSCPPPPALLSGSMVGPAALIYAKAV